MIELLNMLIWVCVSCCETRHNTLESLGQFAVGHWTQQGWLCVEHWTH